MNNSGDDLTTDYNEHEQVLKLVDVIMYCTEGVSIEFSRWGEPHVRGPGLYFAEVSGSFVGEYADPMGENQWPVDGCRVVGSDIDSFFEAASEVAVTRDGPVVVSVNGEEYVPSPRRKLSVGHLWSIPLRRGEPR